MGLDLIVESCAKAGHDAEWRLMLQRAFDGAALSEADTARFAEISVPAFERLGAPRVGFDGAADAWAIETRQAGTPEEVAATLKDLHGYHVLGLVTSDGVPAYSHGGLYDGVDETSFRGAFLGACEQVLPKDLIDEAWGHKFPEAAVAYGHALLAAADSAARGQGPPPAKPGFLARLGLARKRQDPFPIEEQLDIVRAAGRWFVFWGERGHAIRAWA